MTADDHALVYQALLEAQKQGVGAALATVIETSGSMPRRLRKRTHVRVITLCRLGIGYPALSAIQLRSISMLFLRGAIVLPLVCMTL